MKDFRLAVILLNLISVTATIEAQEENRLKISGGLLSDQRILMNKNLDWAWNENRLNVNLDQKISGSSSFHSEVWLRNIGLPGVSGSSDLYNKGIVDPYNLEIREAYFQVNGFLSEKLDLRIGRQRIAWGTADKLNPTDNLNPHDLEDILDFGRHRGSDAIRLNYYFNNNFSIEGVYIPIFQPANMPVGIFADAFTPSVELPPGMVLLEYSDTILMPHYNLAESSTAGIKFKGFLSGVDFSLSYVWGYDGIPFNTWNTLFPVDMSGGTEINSELSYSRTHILGADLAASLAGFGLWAEAAMFISDHSVIMTNDLSAFYPGSPVPVTQDSLILDKTKPYLKFVIGTDYHFSDGYYLNIQYMNGYIHERGRDMDDYFFLRFEKTFFNEKLRIAPVSGAFIVADRKDLKNNYAYAYMPEIAYQATDNTEMTISVLVADGKGENMFAGLKNYDMLIFKFRYSF